MGGFGRPSFFNDSASFFAGLFLACLLSICSHDAAAQTTPESYRPSVRLIADPLTTPGLLLVQWSDKGTSLSLVQVPAGPFAMGAINGDPDEKPIHNILLDTFWIGRYEITARQYAFFLNWTENNAPPPAPLINPGSSVSPLQRMNGVWTVKSGREDYPACGVTWLGAKAFCKWLALQTDLPFVPAH